jgi:phosphatidate cytidylyltransferase
VVKVEVAKESKTGHEVRDRVVSGFIMVVLLVTLTYVGGWAMYLAGALIVAFALWEFYGVMAAKGWHPFAPAGVVIGLIFLTSGQLNEQYSTASNFLILGTLAITVLAILVLPRFTAYRRSDLWLTLLGAFYVGLLASFGLMIRAVTGTYNAAHPVIISSGPAALLRDSPQLVGFAWLVLAIGSVAAADIGAYAVGTLFGKHKLAPGISPKKTWEGFAGGMASCLLIIGFVGSLFGLLTWPWAVVMAIVLSTCDLLGDLTASIVKRYAGVKNYGNLIPGHGGVMDRIDGQLVAMPIAYAIIRLIVG